MTKTFFARGFWGFFEGIGISHIIAIIVSGFVLNGSFSPVSSALIVKCGNELYAVLLQSALSGIIGFIYAGASVLWEKDNWGLVKKTGIIFTLYAFTLFPIAYILEWLPITLSGIAVFAAIFVSIFFGIWIVIYIVNKRTVEKLNNAL